MVNQRKPKLEKRLGLEGRETPPLVVLHLNEFGGLVDSKSQ